MFPPALRSGGARDDFGLVRAVAQDSEKPLRDRLVGDGAVEGVEQHAAIRLAAEEALDFRRSRIPGADLRHEGRQDGRGGLFCHVLDLLWLCPAPLWSDGVASRVRLRWFSLADGYGF